MELTEKRKTIIIVAILAVIALVSIFLVSGVASSEDSFTGTYSSLDAKRTTVTELMGVTAASSTAISLLPGDAGRSGEGLFAEGGPEGTARIPAQVFSGLRCQPESLSGLRKSSPHLRKYEK